jgi:para-aminobenzoate synthetase/4-amino-4-deoxychorismate lyase
VALSPEPVDERDVFLFHKTTHRVAYERARAAMPGADDVILWNRHGELTESTIANLVLEIDGRRVTPPLASGLLGGVFRDHLLRRGEIVEEALPVTALGRATRAWLVNSVRRWIEVVPPLPQP